MFKGGDMAQIKGKIISLVCDAMALYKDQKCVAEGQLKKLCGVICAQVKPEGWYETKTFDIFLNKYAEGFIGDANADYAIVLIGKKVYPLLKRYSEIPLEINSVLDLLKFEGKGFLLNHQGSGIKPRKYLKAVEGCVIVQAPAPDYTQKFYEGVYLGILNMYHKNSGKVEMTKGAPRFEYKITW